MRWLFVFIFSQFSLTALAQEIWIDAGSNKADFEEKISQVEGESMVNYQLNLYQKKHMDQQILLEKIDFWLKNPMKLASLNTEFKGLQKNYVFNDPNRLIFFEYLKLAVDKELQLFSTLCQLYSNDTYLKNSEPFFESSCSLERVSLIELNPVLAQFDVLLVDGNRINIQHSPYFFTSGSPHQFIFISNRLTTLEVTTTVKALQQIELTKTIEPWVQGTCDQITKSHLPKELNAQAYFSKTCIRSIPDAQSGIGNFLNRNKYYVLSGLLIAVAGSYLSSEYSLAVTLP